MSESYYDTSYPPSLWAPPPPPPTPAVLTSLNPNTAPISTPMGSIQVNGTGFVSGDTVRVGGTAQATTFVSATQLTFNYNTPATAQTVQVTVSGVNGLSNALPFTVTAT